MIRFALLAGIAFAAFASPVAAADSSAPDKIPDFTGAWARIGDLVETYETVPGYKGPGPLLVDPKHPHEDGTDVQALTVWAADLDNPILTPATKAKIKAITDAEIAGIPHVKDEGLCAPSGVPMILNRRGGAIQMLQTPTQITIINARDHQVRFIYLNAAHPRNFGHTWYGNSVGHYEGADTLVVDTIGQNDKTQIDRFGTPHSDQIRVVERYKISPDRKNLTVQFTVEDPGAFTTPWSAMGRFANRRTDWDEQICAENNRFVGTVTVGGKVMTSVPMPTANKADF